MQNAPAARELKVVGKIQRGMKAKVGNVQKGYESNQYGIHTSDEQNVNARNEPYVSMR
jgi:hypothetical protein